MSTTEQHHHQPSRIERLLRPRNMLDMVFGTVAICLTVGTLTFSFIAKPYQQSQDIRQQAYEYIPAPTLSISRITPTPSQPTAQCVPCTDPRMDINRDGVISQSDVTLYVRNCLGQPPSSNCPNLNQQGSINNSGDVNCLVRCLATPSPTATPNPTSTPTTRPSPTVSPTTPPSPSASPTLLPTGTPVSTSTPTPSPIRTCNQTCTTNAQCGVNMRCYQVNSEYKCRLADNPTSDICQLPPDNGLQRSCNEYCADTKECKSGLLCWYNRCRRPDNSENTQCAPPTAAVITAMQASCNTSCSSNRDCAVNLRCYQGSCRLATNPVSATCRPAPLPTTAASTPKGGTSTTSATSPTTKPSTLTPSPSSASNSATSDATLTQTPTDAVPSTLVTPTPSLTAPSKGVIAGISAFFTNLLSPEQANTRRMLLAILAVGLTLIGIAFVINALSKKNKPKQPGNPPPKTGGANSPTPSGTSPSSNRDNQMDAETVPPSTLSAASLPKPTGETPHHSSGGPTSAPPVVPPQATSAPTPPEPSNTLPVSGSMTARLKQKGVTPPA